MYLSAAHQSILSILCIIQVEKTRHVLLLREKLLEQNKTSELSKLDKEIQNSQAKARSLHGIPMDASIYISDENSKDFDMKEKVVGKGQIWHLLGLHAFFCIFAFQW